MAENTNSKKNNKKNSGKQNENNKNNQQLITMRLTNKPTDYILYISQIFLLLAVATS